ncbi:hypothetical protein AB0G20_10465 [Streptomyces sp. NPDC024017]|uniref:hypothetical protein n=1 Tax=Streptomyces sp. NPDC024017 TaxID=3154326 RepID=UPI0033E33EA0
MREIVPRTDKRGIGRSRRRNSGTARHGSANSASVLASLATPGFTSIAARFCRTKYGSSS